MSVGKFARNGPVLGINSARGCREPLSIRLGGGSCETSPFFKGAVEGKVRWRWRHDTKL